MEAKVPNPTTEQIDKAAGRVVDSACGPKKGSPCEGCSELGFMNSCHRAALYGMKRCKRTPNGQVSTRSMDNDSE